MPRPTRIRDAQATSEGGRDPKPDWRARWKQFAVMQLPPTAPRTARVHLRAAVERALGRVPSETDEAEIQDVVMGLVDETLRGLEADTERQVRMLGKVVLVAQTEQFLRSALDRLQSGDSVAMLKRPGYSFGRLRHRLVRRLERDLTGDENHDEVQAVVDAWVDARLAEQPPAPRVSKTVLLAGGAAAVTVGVVAGRHPATQAAAARVVQKGRALAKKGREVLGEALNKLLTPPPAPPTPPGPSAG